jgi:tRNA (cytidine32/uridine32-2'-O)-methyltransferase
MITLPSIGFDVKGNGLNSADLGELQQHFKRIRIVLVEPSLAANIGACARAMKTMGLTRLVVVQPGESVLDDTAIALASGAVDVLESAQVVASFAAALTGCEWIIGTSARSRSLPWPMLTPAELGAQVKAWPVASEVALVFGRERSGLTNEELARCHYHLHIQANPDYSSLNLAAAVQVVCYELRHQALQESTLAALEDEPKPTFEAYEGYFEHLSQLLVAVEFSSPDHLPRMMMKLRRLILRAQPSAAELNALRGILTQIDRAIVQPSGAPDSDQLASVNQQAD